MTGGQGLPLLLRKVTTVVLVACWGTAVWVALWGSAAAGTIVVGALLGTTVAVLFSGVGPRPNAGVPVVRLGALLRLAGRFAWMLLASTVTVTRRILSPRLRMAPAVVAVRLPPSSEAVATVVANAVSLTPGTLTLDATRDADSTVRLIIHALDARDTTAVRQDVLRLHRLVAEAFPRPRVSLAEPFGARS